MDGLLITWDLSFVKKRASQVLIHGGVWIVTSCLWHPWIWGISHNGITKRLPERTTQRTAWRSIRMCRRWGSRRFLIGNTSAVISLSSRTTRSVVMAALSELARGERLWVNSIGFFHFTLSQKREWMWFREHGRKRTTYKRTYSFFSKITLGSRVRAWKKLGSYTVPKRVELRWISAFCWATYSRSA